MESKSNDQKEPFETVGEAAKRLLGRLDAHRGNHRATKSEPIHEIGGDMSEVPLKGPEGGGEDIAPSGQFTRLRGVAMGYGGRDGKVVVLRVAANSEDGLWI